MSLPVGVAVPTTRELTRPAAFAELATAAERLGYAHLWVSDHVLLPRASHVPAGWLREELAALGVPFEQRGRRTDETIRTLRDLWSDRAELTSWPTGAADRSGPIRSWSAARRPPRSEGRRAWATA